MTEAYWKKLEREECCFTCANNRNNMTKDYPCNCEFKNRKNHTAQDMWCADYEMVEDEEA